MINLTAENWEAADEILTGHVDLEAFEVEDCEFDPDTNTHRYFDMVGNAYAISADGKVTFEVYQE